MLEMLPLTQADCAFEGDGVASSSEGSKNGGPVNPLLGSTEAAGHDGDMTAARKKGTGVGENGDSADNGYDGVSVGDFGGDHVGDSDEEDRRLLPSPRRANGGGLNEQPSDLEAGRVARRSVNGKGLCRGVGGLTSTEEARKSEGFGEGRGGGAGRLSRRLSRRLVKSSCARECLVPIRLLEEKRTRSVMFVYAVFSVR